MYSFSFLGAVLVCTEDNTKNEQVTSQILMFNYKGIACLTGYKTTIRAKQKKRVYM